MSLKISIKPQPPCLSAVSRNVIPGCLLVTISGNVRHDDNINLSSIEAEMRAEIYRLKKMARELSEKEGVPVAWE